MTAFAKNSLETGPPRGILAWETDLVLELAQEFSSLLEREEIMASLRRAIRKVTQADGAAIVLLEGQEIVFAEEDSLAPVWKGKRFPLQSSLAGWSILHRRSVVVDDLESDRRIQADICAVGSVQSLAVVPMGGQEPFGALAAYWRFRCAPTPQAMALLQGVADLGSAAWINNRKINELQKGLFEHSQSEQRLRESEARFRDLVETVEDYAIYLLDPQGRVSSWNMGAERIKGYQASEILGRHFSCFYPEEAAREGQPENALKTAAAEGRFESQGWRVRKNGTRFWADTVLTAMRDDSGRLSGFSKVTRDTTRQKWEAERFRAAVESAPNAMVMINGQGRIVLVNAQAEKLFGYARPELLDSTIEMLVPERFRGAHPGFREDFFHEPRSRAMGAGRDLFGRRKDGSEIPVEIGLNPILTDEGRFVLAAIVDISERKRAEERFRVAVEGAPNAMVMINPEGKIILVNAQTEKLFGYDREELLGNSIEILVPARFRRSHPGLRQEFFTRPRARAMGAGRDLYGLKKCGAEIPVEIGLNPFTTDEGTFVLAAIVDITERKRAEVALKKTAEELARSNKELQQFAYVASHDLQEPLRAVAGCVDLLRQRYKGRFESPADELMDHAVDGAIRMQTLIQDLLAYSRLDTQGGALEWIESGKALAAALSNLEVAIREKNARITHDILPAVFGDATQLTQLFQNLIGNALKFHSHRPLTIHIGVERDEKEWRFHVRDNGIGIDPEYFERIFQIFQRLHSQRQYPGTGIGLAICKKIVDRHGGRIWVESTEGEGSSFHFSIPAKKEPHG